MIINIKKKIIITKCILLLGVSMFVFSGTANADTENEHALLAELVQKLNALTPLITKAESQSSPNSRIRFSYDTLRTDLQKIKDGINQPLSPTALEPRTIAPLSGDYIDLRSSGGKR